MLKIIKVKRSYQIQNGNIASYQGGAIVVPCWSHLGTANAISHAINKELKNLGIDPEAFWPKPGETNVPLCTAHFFEAKQLPNIDAYILAACYVNTLQRETDESFALKAKKTTTNALEVARQYQITSIAFPILMAGENGAKLEEIIPSMTQEFTTHLRTGKNPSNITLYAYGHEAYQETLKLAR